MPLAAKLGLNAVVGRPTDPTDVGHRGADSYPKSDLWEGRAKRPNSRGTPRRGLGRANIRGGARPIVTRDDRAQTGITNIVLQDPIKHYMVVGQRPGTRTNYSSAASMGNAGR